MSGTNFNEEEAQQEMSRSLKTHRRKQLKAIQDDIALIARDLDMDPHDPRVVASIVLWYEGDKVRIHNKAETVRNPELFRMEEGGITDEELDREYLEILQDED